MFFLGVGVTLVGVFLLSTRQMNALRPINKLRAGVKMVMFIKRVQKARNIDHKWVVPKDLAAATDGANCSQIPLRISKAAVMPLNDADSQVTSSLSNREGPMKSTISKRLEK